MSEARGVEKPWDVMRREAWRQLAAAVNLPDDADETMRRTISDAALTYARASGMKWADTKADGTAPRRQASGERSAVAGDGFEMPFGRDKGKHVTELDVRSLQWWEGVFRKNIEDPERSRWREQNEQRLATVQKLLSEKGES